MLKVLKISLFFLALFFTIWLTFGCSAQKRLNRLLKNNPQLAKTDTIYIYKTIPGFSVDTTFKKSNNTSAVDSVFEIFKTRVDTVVLKEIKYQVKTVYLSKPCIDKPLKFKLPNGGTAILTQIAGTFNLSVSIPPQQIKTPIASTIYKIQYRYNGRMLVAGFFIGFCFAIFVLMAYVRKGGGQL